MGKGDMKTRRGKINAGSYGKTRPKNTKSKPVVVAKVEKPVKAAKETASKETKAKASAPKSTKAKTEKKTTEEKPKTTRKKKTEE